MHPTATRNQFLRLRVSGLSFATIARRLGVSKPTLIAWSRKAKPDLETRIAQDQERFLKAIDDTVAQQLADLDRRYNFLKQEICSRALRNVSTPNLETLAGELHQKIQNLKANTAAVANVSPAQPAPSNPTQTASTQSAHCEI